jgi:hypothetical protein
MLMESEYNIVGVKSSVLDVGKAVKRNRIRDVPEGEEQQQQQQWRRGEEVPHQARMMNTMMMNPIQSDIQQAGGREVVKKPLPYEDNAIKARSKRIFGSLILGTLQKFQQETHRTSDILSKRQAIDQKLEGKLRQEKEEIQEQLKRQKEERQLREELARKEQEDFEGKRLRSLWTRQKRYVAGFLRTQTQPSLCYLPILIDETIRRKLDEDRNQFVLVDDGENGDNEAEHHERVQPVLVSTRRELDSERGAGEEEEEEARERGGDEMDLHREIQSMTPEEEEEEMVID